MNSRAGKKWEQYEVDFLLHYMHSKDNEELALELGRTVAAINRKLHELMRVKYK